MSYSMVLRRVISKTEAGLLLVEFNLDSHLVV